MTFFLAYNAATKKITLLCGVTHIGMLTESKEILYYIFLHKGIESIIYNTE